jgi:hypothetical protein
LLEFAVPFALVILLLDITLVYHASRTGRLQPWGFIILFPESARWLTSWLN